MSDEQAGDGWSDDAIITRYQVAFGKPPDVHHMAIMCWIRDDLTAEIAKLKAELVGDEPWSAEKTEAWYAGWQMGYEKGKRHDFVLVTRLEDTIATQAAQVEALRRELATVLDVAIARGAVLGYDDADDYFKRYTELTGKSWEDAGDE